MATSEHVYILVRYGLSYIQRCRNDLTSKLSITGNYGGMVLGIGEQVECLEGFWPNHMAVALLEFDDITGAMMWYEGCPGIRQPDWLDGVDMVMVPMRGAAPYDMNWIQISDMRFTNPEKFFDEYAGQYSAEMKEGGAAAAVCATERSKKLRGSWDPGYVIISQYAAREQYDKISNSEKIQDLQGVRKSVAETNSILFELLPLKSPSAMPEGYVMDYSKVLKP